MLKLILLLGITRSQPTPSVKDCQRVAQDLWNKVRLHNDPKRDRYCILPLKTGQRQCPLLPLCKFRHELKFAVWVLAEAYWKHPNPEAYHTKNYHGPEFAEAACHFEAYYENGCQSKCKFVHSLYLIRETVSEAVRRASWSEIGQVRRELRTLGEEPHFASHNALHRQAAIDWFYEQGSFDARKRDHPSKANAEGSNKRMCLQTSSEER